MKPNINGTDKIIRFILAAVLAGLYIAGIVTGWLGIVFVVFAAVLVVTAFINFCPIYHMLGISTRKQPDSESEEE
ncbi:MAG: DUF2892 domain-containing protein [Chitinophagaceae bacterium]|nr:DUF2892 domain-containing protein [Chitinophagaceae bacterium]MCW5915584.1 DUF2892 domain-containing protein [Chitinophagaceae bacterium]MCZ2397504.1 DUF2892 domain-containing protein [Chitinophagales bacterium]